MCEFNLNGECTVSGILCLEPNPKKCPIYARAKGCKFCGSKNLIVIEEKEKIKVICKKCGVEYTL